MRVIATLLIYFAVNIPAIVQAGPPGTQPAPSSLSPKETLLDWDDRLDATSFDAVLRTYAYSGDQQKSLAHAMAEQVVTFTKLQKAVNAKWGKASDAVVMHACGTTTREDDARAMETVNGDHAVISFKLDGVAPLVLIRANGEWKVDIATCATVFGDHLNDVEASIGQITAIGNAALAAIADGKYSDASQLAKELGAEISKVQ